MEDAVLIIRWIAGGGMLALGLVIGLGNWSSFISAAVKKRSTSFVYAFGVAAMLVGICLMPPNLLRPYWWGAFILDFAAGPIWLFMLLSKVFGADDSEESS